MTAQQKIEQWNKLSKLISFPLQKQVETLINKNLQHLADSFYTAMLSQPDSKFYLTNEEVKNRLNGSMQAWIKELFSVSRRESFAEFEDIQKKVGDVHARLNLPVHLVLRGASILKREIHVILSADRALLPYLGDALYYCFAFIDYAMEVMSEAYSHSYDRKIKAEESYRLFAAVTNSEAESERQSKALLDWENELLFRITMGDGIEILPKISDSDFGLWFNHKGFYMFESEQKTIGLIKDAMRQIDRSIEAGRRAGEPEYQRELVRGIRKHIRIITLNVAELFNKQSKLESGRDDLTRLLSRKFLPVIINKEINYSIKNKKPFAVLAVDIDYFKTINDTYGHEAGDMVLAQLGVLMTQKARAGDYIFRVGGEEFIVILVDIKHQQNAVRVANNLRKSIEQEPFITSKGSLHITCSIGVIMHDGHPDYTRLLNDVDQALYDAKSKGRNQVVVKE